MCEFCENIKTISEEDRYAKHPLKANSDDFPKREKLILAKLNGKIIFYGFNKYFSEDDAMYDNLEAVFCPICGKKLTETEE